MIENMRYLLKIRKEIVITLILLAVMVFGFSLRFLADFMIFNESHNDEMDTQTMLNDVLHFRLQDGDIQNEFFRNNSISAHLLLSSGVLPRFITAFPAGNSGIGIWFEEMSEKAILNITEALTGINETFGSLKLFGVRGQFTIQTTMDLIIKKVILSNIRVLRHYDQYQINPSLEVHESVQEDRISWIHLRCDGKSAYSLQLKILHGEIFQDSSNKWHLSPSDQTNTIEVSFKVLTGDTPLTPIPLEEVFHPDFVSNDTDLKNVLSFLTYREKMLAGSWRFLTYFGRDTLITLKFLMNILSPTVIEASIGSVLNRLNDNGEVAHEEDIGEYALIRHDNCYDTNPIFDYKMVDDDFMLAPIVADYLLNTEEGAKRSESFFSFPLDSETTFLDALMSNFLFVLQKTFPFAQNPVIQNLISLKPDSNEGDWRDSKNGLGGGSYSYSVNVGLIPAALEAIQQLYQSGILQHEDVELLKDINSIAQVWREKAFSLFNTTISKEDARNQVEIYGQHVGVSYTNAKNSIQEDIQYFTLALNVDGSPIPILHSDVGFSLLYSKPTSEELDVILTSVFRPFPAGLITPVGVVVANPVFDDTTSLWEDFSRDAYHGSTIWSWQQVLLAAGLDQQIQRMDLDVTMIERLLTCKQEIMETIIRTRSTWSSELWSWEFTNGEYVLAPYGQLSGHISESNAAQLWSTVYLALTND